MPIDFSFLEKAAPQQQEPDQKVASGKANVTIRVDADCFMQCDGEYVDLMLKAGVMAKAQLPTGQHLLEFFSQENPVFKVEKVVDFPESGKNYLVLVSELKAAIAPAMPQATQPTNPVNPYLDQLNRMAAMNPFGGVGAPQAPPIPQAPPMSPQNNKTNNN